MRATGSESSMSKSMQCSALLTINVLLLDDNPFSELGTTEISRGARDSQAMTDEQS